MLKAVMKLLESIGLEDEQIVNVAGDVAELVDDEIKAKTKTKPETKSDAKSESKTNEVDIESLVAEVTKHVLAVQSESKSKDVDDNTPSVEELKAAHAKELEAVKLGVAIDAELSTWGIVEGYVDNVKHELNLASDETVKFDKEGRLSGLAEKREEYMKQRALYFQDSGHNYSPKGGSDPRESAPKTMSEQIKNLNAHRIVK